MPIHPRRPAVPAAVLASFLAAMAAMAATAALVLLLPAAPASAHAALRAGSPDRDARLSTAPTSISLEFSENLDPTFVTITLGGGDERRIATGEPAVSGATGTVTIGRPLANGTYTVAYRVVSADGHPVQGSYRFTVDAPGGPTDATGPPAPEPAVSASRAATEVSGGSGVLAVTAGAVGALVVAGAVAVVLRRRAGRQPPGTL